MPLLNSIVNWINYKRISQIRMYEKHAVELQERTLFDLISNSVNTEWGRKFDFASVKLLEQFKSRVSVQNYEDIEPYITRMIAGEKDILCPGTVRWFAKSSGTTSSRSKYIPVPKESLDECHFRGGKDVLAIYHRNYPQARVLKGKSLTLGGNCKVSSLSNQSFYGDLSAIMIGNLPLWACFNRTPSIKIALIEEFEKKVEKTIRKSVHDNVTSFAGVPSWYLVLLKSVLKVTGKSNILEVWPNLEVFIHGGVKFEPYKEQFYKLIPSDSMRYMETYNASEGFFAIQDDPEKSDMLLMLDYGIFYEFISLDELDRDNRRELSLWDVETGVNYAMVITTNGGLWRYLIGDTVMFTSKSPYRIRITGRTKHFINAFGEELIIDNAEQAIQAACSLTGAIVKEYTAGPVPMSTEQKGRHEWLIEFEKRPDEINLFSQILDENLKKANSDYEAKRHKDITLDTPRVVAASDGTFFEWMKQIGKVGGQNKVPRLSNDRRYLDPLLVVHKSLKDST